MLLTINDRIKAIRDNYKFNDSNFARIAGISQPSMKAVCDASNLPSYKTIDGILKALPEISAEWLLRGDGSMVKASAAEHYTYDITYGTRVGRDNIVGNSAPVYTGDECCISSGTEDIPKLHDEIDRLNAELAKLREENRTLAMSNAALTAKFLPLI